MAILKKPVRKNCIKCGESFLARRDTTWKCEKCSTKYKDEQRPLIRR